MQRLDTRGSYARRKLAQDAGAKAAREFKVGKFVAFQDRENQGHTFPYYIGQTIDSGDSSCIIKELECTEREAINGTSFALERRSCNRNPLVHAPTLCTGLADWLHYGNMAAWRVRSRAFS